MSDTRHQWIVDAVEEEAVRCEVDGHAVVHVPRWLLPTDAAPGDLLVVRHLRETTTSLVEIHLVSRAAAEPMPETPPARRGDVSL